MEWYFAEDRFLFGANNEDDCDKWVCIMNWLLARSEEMEDEKPELLYAREQIEEENEQQMSSTHSE